MDTFKTILDINEASALLGVHRDTVRAWDHRLQPGRIYGQRIYDRDRVIALAAERAERRAQRAATRTNR